MKQRLRLFMTTLLCAMFAMVNATEVTWTASEQGYENSEEVTDFSIDDNIAVTLDKGSNSNSPKYFNTGAALRIYGGGTMTVSGSGITEIVLGFGAGDGTNEISTDVGQYASGTWSGSADEVVFTIGGTTGHRRIASIKVTYSGGTPTITVPKPTFSPEGGTYYETQSVTISNSGTTQYSIYYTTDGSDPATNGTLYTGNAIDVRETTTIKAIAVDDAGHKSSVASATYTIVSNTPITIAEAHQAGAGQTVMIEGKVVAAGVTGAVIYDETDYIFYYNNQNTLYENNDVKIFGALSSYGGAVQFTQAATVTVTAENATTGVDHPQPVEVFGSDLDAVVTAKVAPRQYAKFTGKLTISGNYYNVAVEGATTAVASFIKPYFYESVADLANKDVDVYGYEMYVNGKYVYFVATSVVEHQAEQKLVDDPYFSHESCDFDNLIELQIFNDDPEVYIYYTLDGTTPAEENGMLYEGMIEIHETTTVKAIAIDDNGNESNVVTATFTYAGVVTIAEAQQVEDGTTVAIEGWVVASCANGAVFYDGSDYIYQFNNSNQLVIGQSGKLVGAVTTYGGAKQFSASATYTDYQNVDVEHPRPVDLDAQAIDQAVQDGVAPRQYVKVEGTLTISGNYYNVAVAGTENQVSVVKPSGDWSNFNGKAVEIYGYEMYVRSTNSGKFVYMVATSVAEKESDVATPYFSHETGNYESLIELQIFDEDPDVTIYYTLDGSEPSVENGTLYEGMIEIRETTTVKAIAYDDNDNTSNVATATFTFPEPTIEVNAKNVNSNYFVKIESLEQLEDGDAIFIVNEEAGKVLSTEQKTNNRGVVDVNISSNCTINLNELGEEAKLIICQNNGYYYFYDPANKGFLYASSSSTNQLKTENEPDANAKAELGLTEEGNVEIVFKGSNTRNVMQYNSTSDLFACYASASQKPIQIYVEVEKPSDVKDDPELAFTKTVVYVPVDEDDWEMPQITTADNFDGTISYESQNTDVVTVGYIDKDPCLIPVAAGTAEVKATSAATNNFEAGEASFTVKVYEIEDGVFDFTKGDYYSGYEPSTNTNSTNAGRWRAGNVFMSTGGRNVWYDGANGTTLRLYGATEEAEAGYIIVFAPAGQKLTSITGVGQLVPSTGVVERGTWTGFAESVVLTRGESNVTLTSITVSYAPELTEEVVLEESKGFSRTFVPKRNFRVPAGLMAYKVINVTRREAVFSEVSTLAAGNGVILEGMDETDTYELEALTDGEVTDDFTDNELKVSDGTVVGDEKTIFVYGQPTSDDPLGFYLLREGNTLSSDKGYLEIPEEGPDPWNDELETKYISIVHENATAIENVVRNATVINKSDVIYNISGQRVNNPTHGVYIVNGKKILLP